MNAAIKVECLECSQEYNKCTCEEPCPDTVRATPDAYLIAQCKIPGNTIPRPEVKVRQ